MQITLLLISALTPVAVLLWYIYRKNEEIGRKKDQNICNSLHKATKNFILHKYDEFDHPSDLLRTRLAQL